MSSPEPRVSDLLVAAFNVPEDGIYVERNGVATRGTRPEWLDWPTVRLDEIGPPPMSVAARVRLTASDRRPRRAA